MANNDNRNINYEVDEISGVSIHLSDVIAVIENTDPSAQIMFQQNPTDVNNMVNMNQPPRNENHQEAAPQAEASAPYVVILEQPAPKALRFRYECEGRSAGSIPGANSTPDNKTYPTIQVMNYVGRAVVVVSCVTKDFPYKPHPHSLVGREGCRRGVCTLEINSDDMKMVFSNLGIQCVKKRDIEEALKTREEIRVDPFRTGYTHRSQPSSIDLNSVRLCFQVFLEGPQKGKFTTPVKPVVSEPIYDKKSMCDLVITKLSHCNAFCNGGQEMILLCEKVAKEDISIRFYEEIQDGWEATGEFQHSQVHKQVAISFRTPRYKAIDITEPVKVKIQLRRPSDGATSDPLDFEMLPLNEDQNEIKRKRQRSSDDASLNVFKKSPGHDGLNHQRGFHVINEPSPAVKLEPGDRTLSPFNHGYHPGNYRDATQATPSPQPLSPPNFVQVSPSPSPYLLQNQLQAPRNVPIQNNFQQPTHQSQSYVPNILTPTPNPTYVNGNGLNWGNLLNGNEASAGKTYFNNNLQQQTSALFTQPMPLAGPSVTQNFNITDPPLTNSSILMDLDQLNNLSGDLQSLSFSDFAMDSFSKTGEKLNNK